MYKGLEDTPVSTRDIVTVVANFKAQAMLFHKRNVSTAAHYSLFPLRPSINQRLLCVQ